VLQRLLTEAGIGGFDHELFSVYTQGVGVAADWGSLRSPETYVGYTRTEHFATPVAQSWTDFICLPPGAAAAQSVGPGG
jgi:hypothetical protein